MGIAKGDPRIRACMKGWAGTNLFGSEVADARYRPRRTAYFEPERIVLTKSTNIENLLGLDHGGHTILSWSLNPPEVSARFERDVPSPAQRLATMQRCAAAGYPLRAVLMPIIPIENWRVLYAEFLAHLLEAVPVQRITLGQICIYPDALRLMEAKLGHDNPISTQLDHIRMPDGRFRFPLARRIQIYELLINEIRRRRPHLEIGLCLEAPETHAALNLTTARGRCNCVL